MLSKLVQNANDALGGDEVQFLSEEGGTGSEDLCPQLVFFLLQVPWMQASLTHRKKDPQEIFFEQFVTV